MLRFFRNLRQKLLTENRFSKYLLYAFGEIALVVIGILIALQVNNWNESRAERKQEQAILRQLSIEFTDNLKQLDEKIESKQVLIRSVKRLFDFIDHPEFRDKDSLDYLLGWTVPFSTFDPIENDLASSGSLRLIQSDSLKLLLSLWTSNIKDLKEDEFAWKEYRNKDYSPFLVKHYQLRTIRDVADSTGLLNQFLIGPETGASRNRNDRLGPSAHPVDIDLLLEHPDFEDHLERAISMNRHALTQSFILRERILEILSLLEAEIAR